MQKYRLTILFAIAAIVFLVIAALTTNRTVIAVLFVTLVAFIAAADLSLQRSRRRELAMIEAQIAEREQAQQELAQRAAALEAANQKLAAFSYSISHDLRSLLHSIECFSQTTLEDYADQIDDLGQDYLNRVTATSQRMTQLIDDLDDLLNSEQHPLTDEGRKTEDE